MEANHVFRNPLLQQKANHWHIDQYLSKIKIFKKKVLFLDKKDSRAFIAAQIKKVFVKKDLFT